MVAVPRAIPDPVEPTRSSTCDASFPRRRGAGWCSKGQRSNAALREHWDIVKALAHRGRAQPLLLARPGAAAVGDRDVGSRRVPAAGDGTTSCAARASATGCRFRSTSTTSSLGSSGCTWPRATGATNQVVISNTVQERLDRIEAAFARFDIPLSTERGCGHLLLEAREQRLLVVGHGRQSAHEAGPRRRLRMAVGARSRRSWLDSSTATAP